MSFSEEFWRQYNREIGNPYSETHRIVQGVREQNENECKKHLPTLEAYVERLFKTEHLTGIDTNNAIKITPSVYFKRVGLYSFQYRLLIRASRNEGNVGYSQNEGYIGYPQIKEEIVYFGVPLYNTGKRMVLQYLLDNTKDPSPQEPLGSVIDTKDPPLPEPLGSAVDSIMKGWLPILKTMNSLTEWKHTIEVKKVKVKDSYTSIPLVLHQYLFFRSDNGTFTHSMTWKALYITGTDMQRVGLSMKNYVDRNLHIVSWVINGTVNFKIKTTDDNDYIEFKLDKIDELVTKINNYFSTKSKTLKQVSEAFNEAKRLVNLARQKLSYTKKVNDKGNADIKPPPPPP